MMFKDKLRMLLERRGIKQAELGRRLGYAQSTANRWATGKVTPNLPQGLDIARVLGVPLDYLADEAQEGEPAPIPSERERIAMDIIREIGWEETFWRLVKAGKTETPTPPTITTGRSTYREMREAAKELRAQIRIAEQVRDQSNHNNSSSG